MSTNCEVATVTVEIVYATFLEFKVLEALSIITK